MIRCKNTGNESESLVMNSTEVKESTVITQDTFIHVLKAAYETGHKNSSMSAQDLIKEIARTIKQSGMAK
ncbi:hypothetical protein [Litchfieldia alkalitelluris]|uniref:hypothetical protein n=1 Tax=Litchfieldia alkalitelluris TaxID=304268 RepID=UPI001958CF76|nr:hypothetical protein [Litchfieldia alkalitelluris]